MAPTYAPLGSGEDQRPHHGQRTPAWIRVLWFFQAAVALLRILFVALFLVAFLLIASLLGVPALGFILVALILGLDIFLSTFIVVTAYRQLFNKADKRTRLRREVYKGAIATWLFISFVSLPKGTKPSLEMDAEQRRVFDMLIKKIWIGQLLVTIAIIGLFYPPLWVAFKERHAEKERANEGRGEIELEDHEIQLLERVSVDTLDGLAEEDEEIDCAKAKA
ncbi:uncharacterized protein N0V89_008470 [Didymosphaeria variabile]|uniref:Uncharacterized protein n=1 Tax=Didymosphaeria variabile TaxID=1932322 RepID=A0A9W9C8J8_9PLEO|nr:uncharacterized protein N0V89_008470 [Didymosphaeria variabile]KAJ4349851.1 hypothetical protein N0V89_008470 [Didymosphaeria variabile]